MVVVPSGVYCRERRMKKLDNTLICPICATWYAPAPPYPWRVGAKCGDLSRLQREPCAGRLMLLRDFEQAECFAAVDMNDPRKRLRGVTEIATQGQQEPGNPWD